jgi:hypothetical protein
VQVSILLSAIWLVLHYDVGLTHVVDDAPRYKRGNRQLLAICIMNIFIYLLVKAYYVFRNKQRDRKWASMTEPERVHYVETTKDKGNKRLEFRFQH